jgi:hypothetical protein
MINNNRTFFNKITSSIKYLALALFICISVSLHAQHSFTVDAPRVVEQNEFFNLIYTANGEVENFNQPSFTGLEVLAGPTISTMSSTQIINGKRTDSREISYTYVLRAKIKSGKATISEASAIIDGKKYSVAGIEIDVVENSSGSSGRQSAQSSGGTYANGNSSRGESQSGQISNNDIFLSLSFSKTKVVKGEPIIATLKLYTRVPIAGFEDIKFPVFNGFWSQEIETPQNINFNRENYNNQIYNVAVLRKYLLLPQQTGNIKVSPAEMICQIQVRNNRGGRSLFDDFFDSYQTTKKRILSKGANITVSPLPSGAPASYGGGVGDFIMDVKLSRDSVKAHEAASLIIDIKGKGNLNLIEAPKITLPSDFERYDLKTDNNYNNSASGISGSKQFEYPFIPRSQGDFVIPPIVYSYYNISSGKYITLQSDSIKIKVTKGDTSSGGGALISGVNKQNVVNLESDIRYISIGAPHLVSKGKFFVGSILFFVIIIIIAILFFVAYKILLSNAKLKGDIKRTRNRRANKMAKSRLKHANLYLAQNSSGPFYEEIHKALLGYISDKLSIQFADMQRETIKETLQSKNVSEDNIESFMTLLDDCELARYSQAGYAESMDKIYEKAIEVISNFENRL